MNTANVSIKFKAFSFKIVQYPTSKNVQTAFVFTLLHVFPTLKKSPRCDSFRLDSEWSTMSSSSLMSTLVWFVRWIRETKTILLKKSRWGKNQNFSSTGLSSCNNVGPIRKYWRKKRGRKKIFEIRRAANLFAWKFPCFTIIFTSSPLTYFYVIDWVF